MAKKMDVVEREEMLASSIADTLNSKSKGMKVAYFLGDELNDSPSNIADWISTGSSILDLRISNRPHGGIPVGRICEFNGLEASGKSLVGAHILANTQKKDGIAVYIDTESAVSPDFLTAIGVDINKMIYIPEETVEGIFESIESIITKVREGDSNKLVTILVDSLAGASTKVEMDSDYDKDGWATSKAIILSKAMRKVTNLISKEKIAIVFTNQLRVKLGAMFGDPYTTSGGKALPFHASVRVRLSNLGQIKQGTDIIGMKTKCKIVKNRMGPPLRTAEFHLYFDSGIDDLGSWLVVLREHKVISSGNWSHFDYMGEEIKFQAAKGFSKLLTERPEVKEYLYDILCDKLIMSYKGEIPDVEDIEIVDEPDE